MMHRWLVISLLAAGSLAGAPDIADRPLPKLSVAMDAMPLLTAHQQLNLARVRVLQCNYAGAVPPMILAAKSLSVYEKEPRGPYRLTAAAIRAEILSYASVFVNRDHNDGVSRIDDWISRVRKLCSDCLYPRVSGSF
jgi:hypothetical protein